MEPGSSAPSGILLSFFQVLGLPLRPSKLVRFLTVGLSGTTSCSFVAACAVVFARDHMIIAS